MIDVGFRPPPPDNGTERVLRLLAVGLFGGFVGLLVWLGIVR